MSRQPIALITGAAGGIGRALVGAFTDRGYQVIASDSVKQPAGLACSHYIQIDLVQLASDDDYASKIFTEINEALDQSGLDALINNAAIQVLGGVGSLKVADWNETLNVNLLAPFLLTQGLLANLEAVGGCVINISSIHARLTKPNFVAYATSKAALSGMTRAMAVDLESRIRVNAIEPAAIATDMLKAGFADQPEKLCELEHCHPQGRIGTPEEVAMLALSLADGDLRFMHGACVSLDGGISGRLHDPN